MQSDELQKPLIQYLKIKLGSEGFADNFVPSASSGVNARVLVERELVEYVSACRRYNFGEWCNWEVQIKQSIASIIVYPAVGWLQYFAWYVVLAVLHYQNRLDILQQ